MISYQEIKGILLWITIWNLVDYLTEYFQIKAKKGIIISLSVLIFIIYYG